MKNSLKLFVCLLAISQIGCAQNKTSNLFPDGTPIPAWFNDAHKIELKDLGKQYIITDYGVVNDSTALQTQKIQAVIDKAAKNGGGVIVIPRGTYLSGALFFKPKTHLYISENGVLKGSDDISNYPKIPSRMEGHNLDYFAALVNAYGVNGFSISGKGMINGNGANYWKAFWDRRKINPKCTNLEVSRPRLVFIWKSNNIQLQDVKLVNSGFWTSHYYQCNNIKLIDLHITSPHIEAKAPSTDAMDIDVCSNVLIKGCYLSVNDDAIALKGGKGPYADQDKDNGPNSNIIIEDCTFGFCHSAYTNGSEAIHNKNVIMRNCVVHDAQRVLWFKMRPDTPQNYEYIRVENITGEANLFVDAYQWTQFFDLQGRKDVPISTAQHITIQNINLNCNTFINAKSDPNVRLIDFTLKNINIKAKNAAFDKSLIKGLTLKNVKVNGQILD